MGCLACTRLAILFLREKKDGLGTQSPLRDAVNFSFVDECGLKLILLIMMLFLDVVLLGIMSLSFQRKNMMLTSSFRF